MCGTYVAATTVTLASPPVVPPVITESGMAPGCYRYTQTGTNAVGGPTSVSTYVRVDTTAPVGGALTANAVAATTGTGSQSWSTTGAWTVERTDYTDPETTLTSTLNRTVATTLTNGTCSSFGSSTTVVGVPTESGIAGGCIRYIFTGRNTLNLTAPAIITIVRIDTTSPTGGTFTVNGSAASAAGSSSSSATGTFTVVTGTAFADAQSGIASSTFTRTYGPTCATLDDTTTVPVTGASPVTETGLAAGCYRYARTGVNIAGLSTTLSTTVTVGP